MLLGKELLAAQGGPALGNQSSTLVLADTRELGHLLLGLLRSLWLLLLLLLLLLLRLLLLLLSLWLLQVLHNLLLHQLLLL